MTWEAQKAAEREAARFMYGRSLKGKWGLEERTIGTVMYFDEQRGFGFIEEDETFDEIFVNRRSIKWLIEPNLMHNLRNGERVTFAKCLGERGFWAAGVVRVEAPSPPPEAWDSDRSTSPPAAIALSKFKMPEPGTTTTGAVHVYGSATIHLTNNTNYNAYLIKEFCKGRLPPQLNVAELCKRRDRFATSKEKKD